MPRKAKAKAATPTTLKGSTKKSASKKSSKKATEVVQEVAPAKTNTVVEETPVAPEVALANEFTGVLAAIQEVTSKISALRTRCRALEKKAVRELKAANKRSKKKRSTGTRTPSGFVKPTKISEELAAFLGKSKGTEMARTEVTKEINAYIRANKLQNPTNGRIILADAKLSKLLNLKKEDELTYFNLQKYMSPHFAKAGAKAPTVSK
jgi:upstream activation factor subunit UAF30